MNNSQRLEARERAKHLIKPEALELSKTIEFWPVTKEEIAAFNDQKITPISDGISK